MRKTTLQQRQIVMAVARSTGIVDLSVFAKPLQGGRTQTVGSATQDGRRTRSDTAADRKSAVRGSAARSKICHQKVKEEGSEALGPLYMSRRSLPHALMPRQVRLAACIRSSMGSTWLPPIYFWCVRSGIIDTDKVCRLSLSVSLLVHLAIAKGLQSFLSLTVWMSTVPTLPIVRRNAHGYQAGGW